ncbi:MAG: hypothetical protein J3K34DRAFT_226085 [Monoraphidium minutum]|nr:MAG: hypothetical protein J3K34DRAFT_226085 [Monoraphidium minutum]
MLKAWAASGCSRFGRHTLASPTTVALIYKTLFIGRPAPPCSAQATPAAPAAPQSPGPVFTSPRTRSSGCFVPPFVGCRARMCSVAGTHVDRAQEPRPGSRGGCGGCRRSELPRAAGRATRGRVTQGARQNAWCFSFAWAPARPPFSERRGRAAPCFHWKPSSKPLPNSRALRLFPMSSSPWPCAMPIEQMRKY